MDPNQIKNLKTTAVNNIITHFADNKDLAQNPKIFTKGKGCYLYDVEGNKYLDTFASLLTTVCGHGREEIIQAAHQQMKELEFFPNYHDSFTVPLIKLSEKLAEISPGDLGVSFFVNSGSEANETAAKMALQYHWERGEKTRRKIIARRYSYHGTTMGGVSMTGIPWFREYFEPLLSNVKFGMSAQCFNCELGLERETCGMLCLTSLKKLIEWEGPESVAAIIMDPLPGSNVGYPLPPDGYLEELREFCDTHGILMIFDEIQTGFGKTGKMFFCEHSGVVPDIMTIGKAFSGGYLPLAAAITTPKIAEVFSEPGSEFRSGSTYGGHTTACATSLANIEIIQKEGLVERAVEMGAYIKNRLDKMSEKYDIVASVRGIGMLWAVELLADRKSKTPLDKNLNVGTWIRDYCWERGMILRNNGDILVIAPALVLSKEEANFMLDLIEESIEKVIKAFKL